jgi:Family of unknown function (DUF6226)
MDPRSVCWDGLKPRSTWNVKKDTSLTTSSTGTRLDRRCVSLLARPRGGSLTIVFTSFPGLLVRLGHWVVEPVPVCGCEACDETAEQEQARLESMVADLNDGSAHPGHPAPAVGGWVVGQGSA